MDFSGYSSDSDHGNEERANEKDRSLLSSSSGLFSSSSESSSSLSVEVTSLNGPAAENEEMSDNESSLSVENKTENSAEEAAKQEQEGIPVMNSFQSMEDNIDGDVNESQQAEINGPEGDESDLATGRASTEVIDQRDSESATSQKNAADDACSVRSESTSSKQSEVDKSKAVYEKDENSESNPVDVKIPDKNPSNPVKPIPQAQGVQTRKRQCSESIMSKIMDDDIEHLCLLDENSHGEAVGKDVLEFYKDETFPSSFPWHNNNAELHANVPRDIDDLHGVFFADDEDDGKYFPLFSLLDNEKPRLNAFEFTKKRQFLDRKGLLWLGYDDAEHSSASIRRSDDVGIIELVVSLPSLPPNDGSGDIVELPSLSSKRKSLLTRRAQVMSHFPWNWKSNSDAIDALNGRQMYKDLLTSVQDSSDSYNGKEEKFQVCLSRVKEKKKYISNLRRNTHKWNISVKVGGVSSRSKLFPSHDRSYNDESVSDLYSNMNDDEPRSSSRNRKRKFDMSSRVETCSATLPAYVQTGRCVSLETAIATSSNEKLKNALSKDLENVSDSQSNKKKKNNNKNSSQRVFVGRTRLIWTKKMVNDSEDGYCLFNKNVANGKFKNNPIFSVLDTKFDEKSVIQRANSNKVLYTSLLSGQRLDSNSSRRRREVTVGIKINNRLTSAKDLTNGYVSKKEKYIQADGTKEPWIGDSDDFSMQSPHPSNAICVLNRDSFHEALIKEAKNSKKGMTFQHFIPISSDDPLAVSNFIDSASNGLNITDLQPVAGVTHKNRFVMKITCPKLGCISLDDGPLRSVCYSSGIIKGASPLAVHLMLNQAANVNAKRVCTVCWIAGDDFVHECCDCGLLVHLSCCKNKGHSSDANTKWRCAVCHDHYTSNQISLISTEKQISKPLRRTRLPSRFTSDADVLLTDATTPKEDIAVSDKMQQWEKRISKKCILCPYSGGAMSPISDSDDSDCSKLWVHEICRIWCCSGNRKNKNTTNTNKELFNVCVLCGNEEIKPYNKSAKEKSAHIDSTNKEMHDEDAVADSSFKTAENTSINNLSRFKGSGLVKCAASGCSIRFHPFCAMMASKCRKAELLHQSIINSQGYRSGGSLSSENLSSLRSLRNSDVAVDEVTKHLKEIANEDKELAREFTLQLLKVSRNEGSFGSCFEGTKKTSIVPVAFCGLHNPKRERTLFGCPPMSSNALSSTMHIPNFPEMKFDEM